MRRSTVSSFGAAAGPWTIWFPSLASPSRSPTLKRVVQRTRSATSPMGRTRCADPSNPSSPSNSASRSRGISGSSPLGRGPEERRLVGHARWGMAALAKTGLDFWDVNTILTKHLERIFRHPSIGFSFEVNWPYLDGARRSVSLDLCRQTYSGYMGNGARSPTQSKWIVLWSILTVPTPAPPSRKGCKQF